MAEEFVPKGEGAEEWEPVESSHERGEAQRVGPYVNVARTGFVDALVEATIMAEEVAAARGLKRHQWVFEFRANQKTNQVAGIPIPVDQARPGSAAVRWYEGKGSPRITFHIGGVFTDYPKMRLRSDVRCLVTKGTATDGLPCLIIPLKAQLSTQTKSRETSESQTASTENKDKDKDKDEQD